MGGVGGQGDAQVWNNTPLYLALEKDPKKINWPENDPLPGDDQPFPYFIAGDDAFAAREFLIKPFSKRNLTREQRIFNMRVSRARRTSENAFGTLVSR